MAEIKNTRHETFAQNIAKGMSQRKAYRVAFPSALKWKDETVDSKASLLAKNEKVLARVKELADMSTSDAVMTATQRKEWLSKLIQDDKGVILTSDKLKAVDILNKMDGEYTEKVQVNGQLNNPFAGMTTEELKKMVADE